MEMRADLAEAMWLAMTTIEAQTELVALTRMDWPNLKKKDREALHKSYYAKAFPGEMKPKNYISPADLQRMLGR